MTIRDMGKFVAAVWDWGFLNDCFGGTRIRIGDVDGIVERGDEILFLEGKPLGYEIGGGQYILWRALARRGMTVLILWGEALDPADPTRKTAAKMQIWYPFEERPSEALLVRENDIKKFLNSWFQWANYSRISGRVSLREFVANIANSERQLEQAHDRVALWPLVDK